MISQRQRDQFTLGSYGGRSGLGLRASMWWPGPNLLHGETVCAHHSGCLFPLEKISIHSHLGLLQLLPAPEKNHFLASLYICLPVGLSDFD